MPQPRKITFDDMRELGVRGVLVYCADHRCGHNVALSADRWSDDVRLSDLESRFVCQGLRQTRRRYPPTLRLGFADSASYGLPMKVTTERPFANPEATARKLVELAKTIEAV